MNWVYYNGQWMNGDDPQLMIGNRGYLYGDGLFESIRCKNGKALFLAYHLERTKYGANTLHLMNSDLNEINMASVIEELNDRNNLKQGSRIRLVLTRRSGNTYMPQSDEADLLIMSSGALPEHFIQNSGISVGLYSQWKKQINLLSSFKHSNSLLYVLASRYSKENNFDDCLLLNEHDHICEATSSNVFWTKSGKLFTTPLHSGCINGVLRKVVMDITNAEENDVTLNEMMQADEIFLTNMGSGIRPIKQLMECNYPSTISQMLTNQLNELIT
jgi:branched-chain amino acid aminotransferase